MHRLIPGNVVAALQGRSHEAALPLLEEPHRILSANAKLDLLYMIPTTVRHVSGRYYCLGPKRFSFEKVEEQLKIANPSLTCHPFKARPATNLTDEDLDKQFKRKGQSESVPLTQLKLRWSIIEPLVTGEDKELLFDADHRAVLVAARAVEVVADNELGKLLATDQRARKTKGSKKFDDSMNGRLHRTENEIQRLLNLFWCGGSLRGALIGFGDACGGRGKAKRAGPKKRGHPNAAVKEGRLESAGINVEEGSEHAKIIKFCYDTWVVRGTTEPMALRRMWDDFYSEAVQQPDGTTKMIWIPVALRPTASQFKYWGTKEDPGAVAWRKQLPPAKFDKSYRALMGSASDDVYGIGQRGGMDSTPPDMQFVRAIDRLARVGGGHRIIVIDTLFGYIPGLYMGFEPPSSVTVRLALHNAMDPNKKEWLEDLSLDLPPEDFIPLWFENLWADNTDLRNEDIKKCATGIGTNIHFVPKMRSDLNGLVESGHHILHRLIDHKMLGTTHGRQKERGEVSATDRARHTMFEAIRETVRAIHVNNTAEMDDNRPLRMRLKGVPPTRLHMTLEMIRVGRIARTLHAIDLGRRHLLPRHPGTFTLEGVRLHRDNDSKKVEFIKHISYVSNHPIVVSWCEAARRGGKLDPQYFRATFIVDPYRPRRIWYLDARTGEAIELGIKVLKIRDPDLPFAMTLPDMVDRDKVESAERIDLVDARHQKMGAMEAEQRSAGVKAEQAYQSALEARGGEPSKAALRRDKRENRDSEKSETLFGMPISTFTPTGAPMVDDPSGMDDVAIPDTAKPPAALAEGSSFGVQPPPPEQLVSSRKPRNSLLRAATEKLARNI